MQNFEYLIRSDIHPIAEKEARIHGSRERKGCRPTPRRSPTS